MKNLLVLLTVLAIAMPAMAGVTLTESGKSGTTVTVGYSYDGTASRPRAFALVLSATGGTITSVTPTKSGQSTQAAPGFGIFPGTINLTDPANPVWNTPVEPTTLPGGPSALGSNRVVVALGSLYSGDANKPGNTGGLFTVVCSGTTTALSVAPEATYRGGVVGEDANAITVSTLNITFAAPEAVKNTAPFYADWVAFGKPACWAYRKACRGDADGTTQGNKTSSWSVGTNDLNILGPAWQNPAVNSQPGICADFDHGSQGNKTSSWRVGTNDLNLLGANWQLPGIADCPQDNYNFWTN